MLNNTYQPDKDAGWGLIFRLNYLWEKADREALSGDYDHWELVLDRIFNNLLYRNEMELTKDSEGNIIDVNPGEVDVGEWKIMKSKIRLAKQNKKNCMRIKNGKGYQQFCEEHYFALSFYDIWLRKFMQKHQLYLKESESNPSRALFGGAFKKNRSS